MKGARVILVLAAFLALPLVAARAQDRDDDHSRSDEQKCKNSPAAATRESDSRGERRTDGHDAEGREARSHSAEARGQLKKCPPPPPPTQPPPPPPPPAPSSPPTGVNIAKGTVFADLDANGAYSPFTGDTVLAGVTVQLMWSGSVVATTTSNLSGVYQFDGLGNTGTLSWEVCVSVPSSFTQGPPPAGMSYNGCGGTGYAFPFNSAFQAVFMGNFSMLPL